MLISHLRRFVYVGPPRTASTALHAWLSQPALCEARYMPDHRQHSSAIPAACLEYFCVASIREPLDRAVSLWRHYQENPGSRPGLEPLEFAAFLRALPGLPWMYRACQAAILRGVRLDAVVRFHRLGEDLARLPFVRAAGVLEPLAQINQTATRSPLADCYTVELEELARDYWREDCLLWERWSRSA